MTERFATATGTLPAVPPATRRGRVGVFVRRRARSGWARVRSSASHAALIALCAVGAYAFAETVLGHDQPLFASTALLIALGFNREPKVRKVAEVAVGCTLGILIGDLLMLGLGRGLWQAAVVVFVSVMVARFLDSGSTFTMQMSLQSVLVVLLPIGEGGPFARSGDALVGGALALVVTFLSPQDARRGTVHQLQGLFDAVATVLRDLSRSLREEDSRAAWMALVACRGTHSTLEEVRKELKVAEEQATFNPLQRSSRSFVEDVSNAADRSDLAVLVVERAPRAAGGVVRRGGGRRRRAAPLPRGAAGRGPPSLSLGRPGRARCRGRPPRPGAARRGLDPRRGPRDAAAPDDGGPHRGHGGVAPGGRGVPAPGLSAGGAKRVRGPS